MATNTYVELNSSTLLSDAPSVTFNSISSAYTDLVFIINAKSTGNTQIRLRFNSDSTSNYSTTMLGGDGSSSFTVQVANEASMNIAGCGTEFGTTILNINNYANATTTKNVIGSYGMTSSSYGESGMKLGLWRKSPEAITSITLFPTSGNFLTGSIFSLYGILAEAVSPTTKATGGAVYSDSTYYYHVFGASGTFTPTQSITADTLIVGGGGGGGGANAGAGGGAGGLVYQTGISLTAQNYTITVGSGGTGQIPQTGGGSNGSDSSAFSYTGTGGGHGGYWSDTSGTTRRNGASGGSGGGGGEYAGAGTPGTSTQNSYSGAGFGNAGGSPYVSGGDIRTGGGGGAGGVGGNGVNGGNAGSGGIGKVYNSFGMATGTGEFVNGNYYYAGGGGGSQYANGLLNGAGGYGGGGAGGTGSSNNAVRGKSNTGGGGGGSGYQAAGDTVRVNGGSGLVIVRYAK